MKKFAFICLLLFKTSPAFSGEWIIDNDTNCKIWNGNPSPGESVKWSGQCLNEKATGQGVLQWYLNGNANGRYEGEYRDGKENGKGVYTWKNGDRYEGDWVDGKSNGKGVKTWKNGDRYEGDYVDDVRSGFGVYYIKDGRYLNSEGSEIGKQYGKVIGLWRNHKLYKRFYDCASKTECEKKEAREIAEENARKKAWAAELNNKNPQAMYLKAGSLMRKGDSAKATELYEAIIDHHAGSVWAVKASDQLDQNRRENSARESISNANSDAAQRAYRQCKIEMDSCYSRTNGKGNCYRDCSSLH